MMFRPVSLAVCALLLACAPLQWAHASKVLDNPPAPPTPPVPPTTPAPVFPSNWPAQPTAAPAAAPTQTLTKPARIPYKQDKGDMGALASQSLAGLVLAALAAYGIVLLLKKHAAKGRGPLRLGRRVSIVESVRLSRRSTLHIVNYHGEELLFAESEHGLNLVKSTVLPNEQGPKNV